jgi:membrane fusion protein (multidrug efflux system)
MRLSSPRILAAVAAALLIVAGSSCSRNGGNETETDDAVPVELAAVIDTSLSSYISAAGNLEPEKRAEVLAKVEGTVLTILAEEGDIVAEGQVIARLDGTELKLQREQARIRAEAQDVEHERAKSLFAKGLLSQQDYNQQANDYELARSELEGATLRHSYSTIRAPFSGRVTGRSIDVGQTVRIGTRMFTVEDTSPLLCKIYLPSHLIPAIDVGQAAEIVVEGATDSTLVGRVRMISPVVDPTTGTVKVTVELNGGGSTVRPGSFVAVKMITDTHEGIPAIPKKALLSEGGEFFVFAAGSDTARRIMVTTGYQQEELVEVTSGLNVGDSVVVVGQGGIEEGTKIKAMSGPGSASAADSAMADSLSGETEQATEGAPADSTDQSDTSDSEDNQGDTQ